MKRIIAYAVATLALLFTFVASADARPRPSAKKFSANKEFGLGLMIGAPTGLSGKYYLSSDTAIDFGLGVFRRYRDRDGVNIHADFLWHPAVLVTADAFVLPLYFGLGARVFDFDNNGRDDWSLGLRVPVGIAFDFNNVPIDIFLEFAFVFDFLVDRGDTYADLNGALGIRYYF